MAFDIEDKEPDDWDRFLADRYGHAPPEGEAESEDEWDSFLSEHYGRSPGEQPKEAERPPAGRVESLWGALKAMSEAGHAMAEERPNEVQAAFPDLSPDSAEQLQGFPAFIKDNPDKIPAPEKEKERGWLGTAWDAIRGVAYEEATGESIEAPSEQEKADREKLRSLFPNLTPEQEQSTYEALTRYRSQDAEAQGKQAEKDRALQKEVLGKVMTIGGVPLEDSWLGEVESDSALKNAASFFGRAGARGLLGAGVALNATRLRMMGYDDVADEHVQAFQALEQYQSIIDGDTALGRTVGPAAGSLLSSLTQGTVGGAGSKGLAALGRVSTLFGLGAMNNAIEESRAKGDSDEQAYLHGAASFAIEGLGTFLFGAAASRAGLHTGDTLLPQSARLTPKDIIRHGVKTQARSNVGRIAGSMAVNMGEEAVIQIGHIAEGFRAGTSEFLDSERYKDWDAVVDGITKQVAGAAAMGAAGGAIGPLTSAARDIAESVVYIARNAGEIRKGQERATIDFLTGEVTQFEGAAKDSYEAAMEDLKDAQFAAASNTPSGQSPQGVAARQAVMDQAADQPDFQQEGKIARDTQTLDVAWEKSVEAELKAAKDKPHEFNPIESLADRAAKVRHTLRKTADNIYSELALGLGTGTMLGVVTGSPVSALALGVGVPLAMRISPSLRRGFAMDRSLVQEARSMGQNLSPAGQGAMAVMTDGLEKTAVRTQKYLGDIHAERHAAYTAIPKGAKSKDFLAELDAPSQRVVDHTNGITAVVTKFTDLLENRYKGTDVSTSVRDFITAVQGLQKKTGRISQDKLRIVQDVEGEAPRAKRAQDLETWDDQQLIDLHNELFPMKKPRELKTRKPRKNSPPGTKGKPIPLTDKARLKLINELATRRHFTAQPDGHVALRYQHDDLKRILRDPESEEYSTLMTLLAQENNLPEIEIHRAFSQARRDAKSGKHSTEIPRSLEWMPDYLIREDGTRVNLIERDPYGYVRATTEGWAAKSAQVEVFGQGIKRGKSAPGMKGYIEPRNILDEARDVLLQEPEADRALIEKLYAAGTGIKTDFTPETATSYGSQAGTNVANTVRAGHLSLAWLQQPFDIVANSWSHAGSGRTLRMLNHLLKGAYTRDRADALDLVHRRWGLQSENYLNWEQTGEFTRNHEMLNQILLSPNTKAWGLEQKSKAFLVAEMTSDMMMGKDQDIDYRFAVDQVGLSRVEARRLNRGGGTPAEYHDFALKAVGSFTASERVHDLHKSVIEHDPWYRNLVNYQSWTLNQTRMIAGKVRAVSEAFQSKDPKEIRSSLKSLGRVLTGHTVAGAGISLMKRVITQQGVYEGVGSWATTAYNMPVSTAIDWTMQGVAGPIINMASFAWDRDEEVNPLRGSAFATTGITVANAVNPTTEDYRFKGKGPVERAFALMQATVPAAKAAARISEWDYLAPVMVPLSLGQTDETLRAARLGLKDYLKSKGYDSGYYTGDPGVGTEDFHDAMRKFSEEMRKDEYPGQDDMAYNALMEALFSTNTATGEPNKDVNGVVQSLRSRKLLRAQVLPEIYHEEFAARHPRYYEVLQKHDAILDSWADVLQRYKK